MDLKEGHTSSSSDDEKAIKEKEAPISALLM
jgi:hypothetical protein